jgi:hypothetical protein
MAKKINKVEQSIFNNPNAMRIFKKNEAPTAKFWEQADFYQTVNQGRAERDEPPVYQPTATVGDRLYADPAFRRMSPQQGGKAVYWDQKTGQHTFNPTGIPSVYKGEAEFIVDGQPYTFGEKEPAIAPGVKDSDRLYYDPVKNEITNTATVYPVYETVGKDGKVSLSLQGNQQAVYRPVVSQVEEPGAIYTPGPTGQALPQTVDKFGTKGLGYFDLTWNPRGSLFQNIADNFALAQEKGKRFWGYVADVTTTPAASVISTTGNRSPIGALAKGLWSGLVGAAQAGAWNNQAKQQNFHLLPEARQKQIIELEIKKRLAKTDADEKSGGNEQVVPLVKGTTERIANRDLQTFLDAGTVEWVDPATYKLLLTEKSFDQSAEYFKTFSKQATGAERPKLMQTAQDLGFSRTRQPNETLRNAAIAEQVEAQQFLMEKSETLRQQAHQQKGVDPVGSIETLKSAIELERIAGGKSGLYDPYFAYSWVTSPEAEDKYLSSVAQMELELARPLSRYEIWKARDAFMDPWQEAAGETIFDVTNFVSLPVIDDILPAVFKGLGKLGKKAVNKILQSPVVGNFAEYMGRRAVRSQATRYANDLSDLLLGMVRSTNTRAGGRFEIFQGYLDRLGQAIEKGLPERVNVVKELNLPSSIAGHQERIVLGLSNAFQGSLKVGDEVVDLKDAISKGLRPGEWTDLADQARKELREKFYKTEKDRLARNFQLPKKDDIYKQAYDAKFAETGIDADAVFAAEEAVRQAEEVAIERAAGQLADKAVERNLEQIVQIMASKMREGYLDAHKMPKGGFVNWVDSQMSNWTRWVLSKRPAWLANNYVDNAFRYLVHGGNPFSVLDVMKADTIQRLLKEGVLPNRMIYTFMRTELEQSSETVVQRLARGWKGKTGSFLDFFAYAGEKAAEKRTLELDRLLAEKPAGAITNLVRKLRSKVSILDDTLSDGISDWNAAIEAAFSVRIFDQQFHKNLDRLGKWGRGQMETMLRGRGLSDEGTRYALQVWDTMATDPDQLRAMLKSLRAGNEDTIGYFIPSNQLDEILGGLDPEIRANFITDVNDKLLKALDNARANGVVFDSNKFFDTLIDDWDSKKPSVLNISDLRDAPDLGNVEQKLGEMPDPTPSPKAEPQSANPMDLPDLVKTMERATTDLVSQRDPRRLVADLRDALGKNGTVIINENVVGRYAVSYADGKVAIQLDAKVLKGKAAEVRAVLQEAVIDATALIDEVWAAGNDVFTGRSLVNDLRKFITTPGELKKEAPRVFAELQKRFDDLPQRRKMLAGLQGKDRLRYHEFAEYDGNFGTEIEIGATEAEIKKVAPPEYYANGDYQGRIAARVADARDRLVNTPAGNYLSRMQETTSRAMSTLYRYMLDWYPGPLRKNGVQRMDAWEDYFRIKSVIYERLGQFMEQEMAIAEGAGDAIGVFDQSLSQIMGRLGFVFDFKKNGELRKVIWFDGTGRAERKVSLIFNAKNEFIQRFFGKNAVDDKNLLELVRSAPYRGWDTTWNPKAKMDVVEPVPVQAVPEFQPITEALTDEDKTRITALLEGKEVPPATTTQTVDPIQLKREEYSQPIKKITDPKAVALIQSEAQEMMDDLFDLDSFEGRALSNEDFVAEIGKLSWGGAILDILKKKKKPRTALIEAFEQVISGIGTGDLTKALRSAVVGSLENGVSSRPAHPYMRTLLGLPDDEAVGKAWKDLGRDPLKELDTALESQKNEAALWDAFIQQPWYDGHSLKSSWGTAARSDKALVAHLRDLLANLPEGVQDSTQEAIQMLIFQVQNFRALKNNFNVSLGTYRSRKLGANGYIPLSKSVTTMPENYQQWFLDAENAAATVDKVDAALRRWKEYAGKRQPINLSDVDLDVLEQGAEEAARLKQTLLNLAAFGPDEANMETLLRDTFGWVTRQQKGKWQRKVGNSWQDLSKKELSMLSRVEGVLAEQKAILDQVGDVEGALPRTNKFMIDYGDYTRFDEMMRYIVPFWKFTSRSFPFWMETLATHPQILAAYGKYINLTRRVQRREGIYTTNGEQMPSLEGYVPVPGTDLWVNPTAALSFKYVIPKYRNYSDDLGSESVLGGIYNWVHDMSQFFGVGLSPMAVFPFKIGGYLQNKPTNALVPQINLLPPWHMESLREHAERLGGPFLRYGAEFIVGSEVPWMDYMVERRLLANLSQEIRRDPANATTLVSQMTEAIKGREDSSLWNETKREMEESDLARDYAGYFTGVYAKEFTDAEVDFQHLRDEVNFYRAMVNDMIGADVFDLDPEATNRYDFYSKLAYETPEGAAVNLYNNLRWVESPTGQELQGEARREAILKKLSQQEVTDAYHLALSTKYQWYQEQLKALPVGADSKLRQKLYQDYIRERDLIENNEMYAEATRSWAMGFKPEEMVYEHFQELWWQLLEETRPQYDGDDWNDYQAQLAQWTLDMPFLATTLASAVGLNQMLTTQLRIPEGEELPESVEMAGGRQLDTKAVIQNLISQTTPENYAAWQQSKDSPMRAMDKAWQELYWNKYWDTVNGLSGYERELAEQNFVINFPKPTTEAMTQWVMQNYPGRFDPATLQKSVEGRQVESVPSRLAPKDPIETMEQDIWDTLMMAGPNKDALQKAYEQMGGYWASDISGLWYGSGGNSSAWSDPAKFQMFHDKLVEAAAQLGLSDPDPLTLQEWAEAQELEAKRKEMLNETLGEDIMDVMVAYWNADKNTRRQMRNADKRIDEYYNFQDRYEAQFPVWARYYTDQASSSTSTGGGGGSSSGGGGGSYVRKTYSGGGGGGSTYVPASYTIGLGSRSSLEANRLPGTLGKAKPGGSIKIPPALKAIIGDAVSAEIESGKELDEKARAYLTKVATRHPEHKEDITKYLGGGRPVAGHDMKEYQ